MIYVYRIVSAQSVNDNDVTLKLSSRDIENPQSGLAVWDAPGFQHQFGVDNEMTPENRLPVLVNNQKMLIKSFTRKCQNLTYFMSLFVGVPGYVDADNDHDAVMVASWE